MGRRASFRLASKLKRLKQKIKDWNRDVFRRLEVNKNLALQQVEFWDRVESERSLLVSETEMKKKLRKLSKSGSVGRNPLETSVEGVVD